MPSASFGGYQILDFRRETANSTNVPLDLTLVRPEYQYGPAK
jgi:hypothetical protein